MENLIKSLVASIQQSLDVRKDISEASKARFMALAERELGRFAEVRWEWECIEVVGFDEYGGEDVEREWHPLGDEDAWVVLQHHRWAPSDWVDVLWRWEDGDHHLGDPFPGIPPLEEFEHAHFRRVCD